MNWLSILLQGIEQLVSWNNYKSIYKEYDMFWYQKLFILLILFLFFSKENPLITKRINAK